MSTTVSRTSLLRIAQTLLYLNAVIWIVFAFITLLRLFQTNPDRTIGLWIIAFLMLGNAGMMILSGWGLGTGQRLFYYLALAVMLINLILTFTDQFGLVDFITLAIDLAIVAFLILGRRSLSQSGQT